MIKKILHIIIKKRFLIDFNLLYCSSKDGFNAGSFHRNCDNKGATIVIAKIKNKTQLIGGYNPLDWSGSGWKAAADSFMFNFTNGKDISTAKLGYVNNPNNTICCSYNYGPTVGKLHSYYNNWRYNVNYTGDHYPNIDLPANLTVEDYEVFQVIKK